jgi:PAS domain S-box-containing protein
MGYTMLSTRPWTGDNSRSIRAWLWLTWLVGFALISTVAFLGVQLLKRENRLNEHAIHLQKFKSEFDGRFNTLKFDLKNLSQDSLFFLIAESPDAYLIEKLDYKFNTIRRFLTLSIVYFIDEAGTVQASSEYEAGKSLKGNNYSFRTYFRESMRGEFVIYPAVGVTTNERGLYISHPVIHPKTQKIIGVVVFKASLNEFDKHFSEHDYPAGLYTSDGIIFSANRDDWMFRNIRPINMTRLDEIYNSRQLASNQIRPMAYNLNENHVRISGRDYLVTRNDSLAGGWGVFECLPKETKTESLTFVQKPLMVGGYLLIIMMMTTILILINTIRERKIAEAKSKSDQKKFHAIFHQTYQFIGLMDLNGVLLEANRSSLNLSGLREEDVLGVPFWETAWWNHSPLLQRQLKTSIEEAVAGKFIRFEATHPTRDGGIAWVDFSIKPIFGDSGEVVMLIPEGRDITERKKIENELKRHRDHLEELVQQRTNELVEANKRNVESARISGRAEIAVDILHNVGNVLNSVMTSANIVRDQLKNSRINSILDISEKIKKEGDQFFNSLKGKRLPELLEALAKKLAEEKQEMITKVTDLTAHVNHISEIISVQQSFSAGGGFLELLNLEEVIRDALKIEEASLIRHGVHISLESHETIPLFFMDRHKILQIFINIFSNAKHSLFEVPVKDRALRIFISKTEDHHYIQVKVKDTGIGIKTENLERIFNHGFSTKKGGHGFGLHGAANIASAMKGSLWAESEGPGKGAVFILRIPFSQESKV